MLSPSFKLGERVPLLANRPKRNEDPPSETAYVLQTSWILPCGLSHSYQSPNPRRLAYLREGLFRKIVRFVIKNLPNLGI